MAGDAPGTDHENPAPPGVPPAPLALYRKYRPATFAEVKGQEHVTEPLQQALRSGRVHHAYLFSGPRGCGKTSCARILARSLNCEQGPTPEPCGVCASCVALAPSGPGSIDVIEIDAASHGGVDDARELRERAFYAPVSGRFKIYIIDEAHMVTREGFNALLKLVEEPPPHLKFVFATTEPEKVIATIRSRTHHYPFRLVPPAVLRELLEQILAAEGVTYQPAVLPLVVRAGAGSVRDSLSILDQLRAGSGEEGLSYERTVALLGYTDDSLLDEMVDAFASGDGAAAFTTVDRVVEGGHDPRRFASDLLDRLRDLIILAAVPSAGQTGLLDAPADRLERMTEQASRFGQAELTRAAEILSEGLIQMRGTTSPRLLLELVCAQVLLPGASTGERALLARLDRLERRLASQAAGPAPASQAAGPPPASQAEAADSSSGTARHAPAPSRRGTAEPAPAARSRPGGQDQPAPAGEGPVPSAAGRAAVRQPPHRPAGDEQPEGERGTGRRSVPSAGRPGAAGAPPGHQAAGRPGGGTVDVALIRDRWPEILDAVRAERKVAWILLSSAAVQSLENGVLTIAFPQEGAAKGFTGSGHDQVLAAVLAAMLGTRLQVRGVFAAGSDGRPAGPQPGDRARPPASDRGGPGGEPDGRLDRDDPERGGSGHGGAGWAQPPRASQGPGAGRPRSADAASPPGAATPGPGPAPGEPASRATGRQPAQRRPAGPGQPPASAFAGEDWPDDAGPAGGGGGSGAAELTGMELIRRQLGGQIIAEIEEG